ncbi:MAG: hypothetical protein NWE79_01535 [Candidatus Bathyarchaeota archaeon]|nr:hypothetical protein [Candidatus Bathyarchaeota archaeon]
MKLSIMVALVIAGFFPALTLYAWQAQAGEHTEQEAMDMAVHFLRNGPTFKFDGIPESLSVKGAFRARTPIPTWSVVIEFKCRHADYGDRTGRVLAQVVTPHEIAVIVEEGRVIRAVVDEVWDELNQREVAHTELLPPEFAKDLAIEYILKSHSELGTVPLPEVWAFEILTPEGLVCASTQQFVGDGWTVNVSFPVVMRPVYTISVRYSGNISFAWEGTVDQSGNIEETSISIEPTRIEPEILSPEDARDIAIAYLIEHKEELKDLQAPASWTVKELTPPGLVGYYSQQFTGGGWTVNVSNPVVWKPVYTVEIEYVGKVSFLWEGTVDQSGNIEEISYTK